MKISQKQTSLFTEEALTSSQEDSPVSPTAVQEKEKAKQMSAICGPKCLEQFERLPRITLWAKMFMDSLIGQGGWFSTKSKLIWKLRGTKYNQYYCQLQVSMLPTEGTGFGLLLTPSTMEIDESPEKYRERMDKRFKEGTNKTRNGNQFNSLVSQIKYGLMPTPKTTDQGAGQRKVVQISSGGLRRVNQEGTKIYGANISDLAANNLLPTPNAMEAEKGTTKLNPNSQNGMGLTALAKNNLIATPKARDWKGGHGKGMNEKNISDQLDLKGSQLNPLFVAEMMGFPPNWTIYPFQSGEMKASKDLGMP